MPSYLTPFHPEIFPRVRYESAHARRDRYRGELKITTPAVTEELRKRWYGAPPTRLKLKRRPDTFTF